MADDRKERDGTSQTGRVLAALDPGYVSVDERTIEDLVAFARSYGKTLAFYGDDDRPAGDFGDFIGSLDPAKVAAFLRDPSRFDPKTSPALFRPHFVLFLAFLGLFEKAQGEMGKISARHLEFYFQAVLRMDRKKPTPDRVNLVFDLARGAKQIVVPKGSRLSAGPDSAGRERIYSTDVEVHVNRIKIVEKRAVFVDRRVTNFAQARARQLGKDDSAARLAMLEIALGEPLPGDALPLFHGRTIDDDAIRELCRQVDIEKLPLLRDLVRLQKTGQWSSIPEQQAKLGMNDAELAAYQQAIERIESYFFLRAESFYELVEQMMRGTGADWSRVDGLLVEAYAEKVRRRRIAELEALRGANPKATLEDLIRHVLDNPEGEADDLLDFLPSSKDLDELRAAAEGQAPRWDRVYSILEVAWRNRIGEPPPQKEEWRYLYQTADVAIAGARPAIAGQDPRWATFGGVSPLEPGAAPPAVLGFGLATPLLAASEGTRNITLTLGFQREGVDLAALTELFEPGITPKPLPLILEVSTAKGWVECRDARVDLGKYAELAGLGPPPEDDAIGVRLSATFGPSFEPIAALPANGDVAPWPALRLMLRPLWSEEEKRYTAYYRELGGLVLARAHLRVDVEGLAALLLESDEATLDAKKPFEPFGVAPAVGSRLRIGHPEIAGKNLDGLVFSYEWLKVPADLVNHYKNYAGSNAAFVPDFRANVFVADRSGATLVTKQAPVLFDATDATKPTSIRVEGGIPAPAELSVIPFGKAPSALPRHFVWELCDPDFQHEAYPAVASRLALELAADIANGGKTIVAENYRVKPPYTPKLKRLSLAYSSAREFVLDAGRIGARIFHVHPFGESDIEAERTASGLPFLPRYDDEGELYLGMRDVDAPQTVSILFQMAEGSANPDVAPPPIRWSHLSGDRWLPLEHRLVRDGTRGLVGTGIVEIALEPAAPSTRLGGGLYWIRASVARDASGVCDTVAILPHAASATFVDQGNAPDHYRSPLPAGTIKKLVPEIRGIAGARQPYASFGGRMAESDAIWGTRVSERLRHKQRAVSVWDYERLVLERFPEIYKAKCIPASADRPGQVDIVVIPDIRNLRPSDPFEPKASPRLLAEVEAYLATKVPAFAKMKAKNACYVPVRVKLRVRFESEGNDAYYLRLLEEELNRFLSPWAYQEGADIAIGGRIYANSIVDFVDRRPYVDYVAAVRLFYSEDGVRFRPAPVPPEGQGVFVETTRPDAVLVAAREHDIEALRDAVYDESLVDGIGFMKLELDFIVA